MQKVLYIFGQLTDSDIQWLINNGTKRKIGDGEILIREGGPIEQLYIVLEGSLIVCMGENDSTVIAVLGTGEIVGEMSFVDSALPSATVKSLNNAVLYAIDRSILFKKIKADTGFASRFYHAIAIFLADRLRSKLGANAYYSNKKTMTDEHDADELDPQITENLVIAGERFNRILKQMLEI